MRANEQVLYASGGDGKDYLLSVNGDALVAREFNINKLTLGPPHTLVDHVGSYGMPVAVSPGGILIYPTGATGARLTWMDRAGKTLDVLTEADKSYSYFRQSPDGRRFVAARLASWGTGGPASELWMLAMERHVFSLFSPASIGSFNVSPVWSNDGQTVLFNKSRIVLRKDITASGEGERIAELGVQRLCDWSRDGRYLLYESPQIGETGRDLWVAPMTPDGHLAEGAQPKPYIHGPFAEWQARFSPEPSPRWVAYVSDETGRNEVYIASFPDPKRRLQVTSGGGTFPQWGHDGRELFYISGDGMLTVVGLKTGAAGLDLDLSSPQRLFPLAAGSSLASPYEVSPDGKRILVNQAKQNTELHVVVNWPLLLRRQAAQ